MNLLSNLWRDERGNSSALGVILLTTILAIGAIVGLSTVRLHLVQQFGDVAVALENLNQSFTLAIPGPDVIFIDADPPLPLLDPDNAPPACLNVQFPASDETP